MRSLLRIGRIFVPAKTYACHCVCTQTNVPEFTESIHKSSTEISKRVDIIGHICDLLRRGGNWDILSERFHSIDFNDLLVEKVLLELKEPATAKRALSFFHWSARQSNFEHGIRSYCITIHILVRARILIDARALLESVIKKSSKDGSSGFLVVELLLSTYKSVLSSPFVFDLLIQTYSKLRMFDTAFKACQYIEEHGFSCSLISFNALIHVVQKSDRTPLVWNIYEYMIQRRTYPNEITVRIMISALCKEGNLQKFIDILDRIHGKRCSPGVIVNTSVIFRILEDRRVDEGIILLKRMLQRNVLLDDVAYSLIIYGKCKIGDWETARKLFDEMLKRGFDANAFLCTLFIGGHCKEGKIEKANLLLEEMRTMGLKPYEETFNVLIEGCSNTGRLKESLSFCEEMIKEGLLPSLFTFNEMVGKLRDIGDVRRANEMLTVLLGKGFLPNEVTYSYLMDGYGKEGEIQEVFKLYYEMEYRAHSPGEMIYTSLIRSLCGCGKLKEAEKYLRTMEDRSVAPTLHIYETLISSYYEKGDMARALQLYDDMVRKDLKSSCHTFIELVDRIRNASSTQKPKNKVLDNLRASIHEL